jgi:hypothetical protein
MVIGGLFLSLGKLILWWALGRVRWRLVRLSIELTLKYCLKSVRRTRGSREYKLSELRDIHSTLRLLSNP